MIAKKKTLEKVMKLFHLCKAMTKLTDWNCSLANDKMVGAYLMYGKKKMNWRIVLKDEHNYYVLRLFLLRRTPEDEELLALPDIPSD